MIITNARIPFGDETKIGTLVTDGAKILSVDEGLTSVPEALDWEGDYCFPGLIEMHTDNMENHFVPRPKVIWPNGLAACLVHDAQMAAAGVTTVYDAVMMGTYEGEKSPRKLILKAMLDAVAQARDEGVLRIDHRIHLRAELSTMSDQLLPFLEDAKDTPALGLVSIMDHTPGQRQWRDLEKLMDFIQRTGKPRDQVETEVKAQMERGAANAAANRAPVIDMFEGRDLVFASHDDTTVEHVEQAAADGIKISEFPCSIEAARAVRAKGMMSVGGAPNIVRGGSHSGNVSMAALEAEGLLDTISSDYVPAALLQAVWKLAADQGCSVAKHLPKVTRNTAAMVGLHDRGWLEPGLRADFIRVADVDHTPIVKETHVGSARVC